MIMKASRTWGHAPKTNGFTLIELVVVIATVGVLAMLLLPALASTHPDSQVFQCLNNQRQIILGWQMYAEDNSDLLPPNDYPFASAYATAANKNQLKNWVVGTMTSVFDATAKSELVDTNSLLSPYVTNSFVYHCPADNISISGHNNVRSYSMNSAVGTIWNGYFASGITLGSPVQGGWLSGSSFNANQTTWMTYGKMSSFTRPSPANTWVIIDENPNTINDGSFASSALATSGNTYLIDYASGLHGGAGGLAFADGHSIIHKWQDRRTYNPPLGMGSTKQTPDNPDCLYLAPLTSAPR